MRYTIYSEKQLRNFNCEQPCYYDRENYFAMRRAGKKNLFTITGAINNESFTIGPFTYSFAQQQFKIMADEIEKYLLASLDKRKAKL